MTMLHSTALRCLFSADTKCSCISCFVVCLLLLNAFLHLQYDTLAIYLYIHNPLLTQSSTPQIIPPKPDV